MCYPLPFQMKTKKKYCCLLQVDENDLLIFDFFSPIGICYGVVTFMDKPRQIPLHISHSS